jgi:enamine deaminase RidA (YjgF/YER057c/UK114 family)
MTRRATSALALAGLLLAAPAGAQQVERMNPPALGTPQAYTHVVKVGKLLFIAGQVGTDAAGQLAGPGMKEQLERVLENLKTALASQGADFRHVAKITIFVTSIDEFRAPGMAELRAKYFGEHRPASTLVQVVSLANPAFKVEIEAVAALP